MSGEWLPDGLHAVAMRLARADMAVFDLAGVALAWSRGPADQGAMSLRQVERVKGTLDVEVEAIRPLPPIAAMLFSEAVHHLRCALDNVVFYLAQEAQGQPFTGPQARAVTMPIYDDEDRYGRKVQQLVKQGLVGFDAATPLGQRIARVQPFNDETEVPAIPPGLSVMSGELAPDVAHPLALLRDYSNDDKHRAVRLAAGRMLAQRPDDWQRSAGLGMREVSVGAVIERVQKGVPTEIEISPALHVERPNGGAWVSPAYELDCITRHVCDEVIPYLVTGMVLPDSMPLEMDLSDTGETPVERLSRGGTERANTRARRLAFAAFLEAMGKDIKFAPMYSELDESGDGGED